MPKKIGIYLVIAISLFTVAAHTVSAGTTPPDTVYTMTPSSPDGDNGWYVSPVRFDLESTDLESGVASLNYRIDGGTWQTIYFPNSLNLAPNPSFETSGATTSGCDSWNATVVDSLGTYAQDTSTYYTGFATSSAQISATGGLWHGINHYNNFAVTTPYSNMSASAWVRTQNVTNAAFFKIYAIAPDGGGGEIIQEVAQSGSLTGTNGWTRLTSEFTVTLPNATGVYMDIGLSGPGTMWVDAVTLDNSVHTADTSVIIASDRENHRFEFYATDNAGNVESYSCTSPVSNCVTFDLDQTPPGNWHNSGAFRGIFGSAYQLWVYTEVEDPTAGLQAWVDKFQYKVPEYNDSFGKFSNILSCSSTWQPNQWVFPLITLWPFNGVKDAYLLTPKTSFCNTDWRRCKTVRFYSIDMAGNESTKEFCINGPWIKIRGEATTRSNKYIDMLSEADGDNTDGLIEVAENNIDYFTSSKDWEVIQSPVPPAYTYNDYWDLAQGTKTEIVDEEIPADDGVYYEDGNLEIGATQVPSNYDSEIFNQVIFVDGDLEITTDVDIDDESAALYIVSGDGKMAKHVVLVDVAIFADGDFYTAHDIAEGDDSETLELYGLYSADEFFFQRTLQGVDNSDWPSEDFTYEPKYLVKIKDYFGTYSITWERTE